MEDKQAARAEYMRQYRLRRKAGQAGTGGQPAPTGPDGFNELQLGQLADALRAVVREEMARVLASASVSYAVTIVAPSSKPQASQPQPEVTPSYADSRTRGYPHPAIWPETAEASRPENSLPTCPHCDNPVMPGTKPGRQPLYCSSACRVAFNNSWRVRGKADA